MPKRLRKRPKPRRRSAANRVFLSHAAQDRPFVERLVKLLRKHNVAIWYSSHHLVGAQQWHDRIGRALQQCRWFVLVLSPRSVRSRWVRYELNFALDARQYEERIVPVLYRPCNIDRLSWVLRQFQRVDFTSDFDAGAAKLLKVWGKRYKSPTKRRLR